MQAICIYLVINSHTKLVSPSSQALKKISTVYPYLFPCHPLGSSSAPRNLEYRTLTDHSCSYIRRASFQSALPPPFHNILTIRDPRIRCTTSVILHIWILERIWRVDLRFFLRMKTGTCRLLLCGLFGSAFWNKCQWTQLVVFVTSHSCSFH